jgi:hypothetical protein
MFATPYGFGALFFFQCEGVRSSEWCVKNSLTWCSNALFHACLYGIRVGDIRQMIFMPLQILNSFNQMYY